MPAKMIRRVALMENSDMDQCRTNIDVTIRTAKPEDAQSLVEIYAFYVENTALTYECTVPTLEEFQDRITQTLEQYPFLVAEDAGEIIGYACAHVYHPWEAYAWNAETTIYMKQGIYRRGVGRKLYSLLEEILKEQGVVKVIAKITLPVDAYTDFKSRQFHEKMGYRLAGRLDHCGFKFNRWYTTICMDKLIGTPAPEMRPVRSFAEVRGGFCL